MNAPFRTPDVRPRPTDAELANAFRDLESSVNLARCATIAAEMMLTDAWACGSQALPLSMREQLTIDDRYHVLVLTDDQFLAVEHLMSRARDEADALYKAFYAGFEEAGKQPK